MRQISIMKYTSLIPTFIVSRIKYISGSFSLIDFFYFSKQNFMRLSMCTVQYTQRVITSRGAEPWRNKLNGAVQGRAALHTVLYGQRPRVFFKIETVCWPFRLSTLHEARAHISVGWGRRGGNISVDLSLLVTLCNTNFMNKLKLNDF